MLEREVDHRAANRGCPALRIGRPSPSNVPCSGEAPLFRAVQGLA
jgi:hypothetical protein